MNENKIDKKFNNSTPNFRTEAANKIAKLFPEIVSDGKIDFSSLEEALSQDLLDNDSDEKYEFTWRGKLNSKKIADSPLINATLVPDKLKSIDWDNTKNVYIEGDNLEVLKLLQKSYEEQIKLIYMDPPYNTGNDFIYNDDFKDEYYNYLKITNQINDKGEITTTNKDTSGRFHTNWLNMMYPRIKLSRNLLKDDGVIMVSIGNKEQANLEKILDEIFGEYNRIAKFIVNSAEGGGQAKYVINGNEFVMVYAKDISHFDNLKRPKDIRGKIVNIDGEDYWIEEDAIRVKYGEYGPLYYEDILKYRNQKYKDKIDEGIKNNEYLLVHQSNGKHIIGKLRKLSTDFSKFNSIIKHLTAQGKKDARADFGFKEDDKIDYFNNPKPISLMKDMIRAVTFDTNKDIILDAFSGSGTTARAVQELNVDGRERRFIMIQLPEDLDEAVNKETNKSSKEILNNAINYLNRKNLDHSIASISEERIRLGGILTRKKVKNNNFDYGYKVYKLSKSNINNWDDNPDNFINQLEMIKSPFTSSSNNDERSLEISLKSGIRLDSDLYLNDGIYHYISNDKELFVILENYNENILNNLLAQCVHSNALVILRELSDGSKIKFNILEKLRQEPELNNHFSLEWI